MFVLEQIGLRFFKQTW